MTVIKVFIVGLPGSGKSDVARYIATYAKNHRWETSHFNDYEILQQLFLDDTEQKQFKPAERAWI